MSREQTIDSPMLIWRRSDGTQVEYDLSPELPVTIGREVSNRVSVDSSVVSKAHAVVRYEGGNYVVEDLKSSNGTRLNGAPIAMSVVAPGDLIEVGDQQFCFVDATASADATPAARQGPSKMLRLALAAFGTLVVFLFLLILLVPADPVSDSVTDAAGDAPPAAIDLVAEPVEAPDETLIGEVVSRARMAGVGEVEALYDEAQLHTRAGRLRHAVHLFSAVLARDGDHEAARHRLATVQAERRRQIETHLAEAERAFGQLQFRTAKLEWEWAVFLLEPSDVRLAGALAGVERAGERLPRD